MPAATTTRFPMRWRPPSTFAPGAGYAIPRMLEAPGPVRGRFVAVASAAGAVGLLGLAAYAAAKHAVVGYVRALAADLGTSGITVNAVSPGTTRTPMAEASARLYG